MSFVVESAPHDRCRRRVRAFQLQRMLMCVVIALLAGEISASTVKDGGITIELGQRADKFGWNIAGDSDGASPNILSELNWPDLRMRLVRLSADGGPQCIHAQFTLGDIISGSSQDSDYAGDDRTQEFLRTNNRSDQGRLLAGQFAVGCQYRNRISLTGGILRLQPRLGFQSQRQWLHISDGFQTLADNRNAPAAYRPVPSLGPFSGLDSRYSARWRGPFIGFVLSTEVTGALSVSWRHEYHRARYYGEADWNLIRQFQHPRSYDHTANGQGWIHNLGADWRLRPDLSLVASVEFQRWWVGPGVDRVYFTNGAIGETRLNEARWSSHGAWLGVTQHF